MSLITASAKLRSLADEAQTLITNKSTTMAQKKRRMDQIDVEMNDAKEEIDLHKKMNTLMAGGNQGGPSIGGLGLPSQPISLDLDQLAEMHAAVVHHRSFKTNVSTKTVSSDLPAQLLPGMLAPIHEPTRIADMLPTSGTDAPSVEYLVHTGTTGTAATVAPGALKPAVVLNTTKVLALATKIAVTTVANDEDLQDFSSFTSYISAELSRLLIDVENAQILSGDGTGTNMLGLLNQTGLLTRAMGTDTQLDAIEQSFADLRVGPSLCAPTFAVMHPTTFSKIRRAKDTQGRYLLNADPSADEANSLWGTPVIRTTQIAVGTALVGNGEIGAGLFIRQGISVQTDFGQTGFEKNQTAFRCEERLMLATYRPTAFVKVTGL